ncbi:MAG: chemotaxis protein CheW, partial [Oscillospiraceae bacterium]|nr:chemotaxis protein CheW [Oscillospiraceae bacterium]
KIESGDTSAPAPAAAPSAAAAPVAAASTDNRYPFGLQILFEDGCGMENLRAFMIVSNVRDFCAESDFTFSPADIETNNATAELIIEHGFSLFFVNAADRNAAINSVTSVGSVRTYQAFDAAEVPESTVTVDHAAEAAASAPAAAPVEQKAAPAAPSPAARASAPAARASAPAARASAPAARASAPAAPAPAARASAPAAPAPAARASAPAAGGAKAPAPSHHAKESLISVNLSKLDQLMAVVSEIVITESMVTSSPDLKGLRLDNFAKSARELRKLTDDLQDVSMSLRMVPVSATFQKMNRIVRDMSKKLGKHVKLTLVGEDTEVDKTVVDNLGDPIMHAVRNSMDHGIEESQEDRISAGKNPVGEITLAAHHTGSEVIIEIRDDGRGVDCDHVLAKAIKNGLANPDTEYSQREILNFLMMPGFSTNQQVTEFSGRGVGMDVVKKTIEELGGTVSISSERGHGMTTTLKIPLTMAIMDGMEVSVGNSIFTIPINNIRQSFKVRASDIIYDAAQNEMIKCMDNFYPIIRAKAHYGLDEGFDDVQEGLLLWVESGDISYCLFVDTLIGEQQVVVKPLPSYINSYNVKSRGINGCTILGDGSISIILDVANLYNAARGYDC